MHRRELPNAAPQKKEPHMNSIRKTSSPSRLSPVLLGLATAGIGVFTATAARAQQPPTPYELASQLDYECRPTPPSPPPVPQLLIRQLNPVLKDRIPPTPVVLGPLEQVCVPVAKNNAVPSPRALGVAAWSDLACYEARTAQPANTDLKLTHLNPQLAGLPDEYVRINNLRQLCFPVRKNDSDIPPAIRQIVSFIDQACYDLDEPTSDANTTLLLTHLNPVIRAFQFPNRVVDMQNAQRLCVPIAKNNEVVPPGVRDIVEWLDFLKYGIDVIQGGGPIIPLWLTHLNPLFAGFDRFLTTLQLEDRRLMVPVAKNDHIPPGGDGPAAR
jgi:hypothetical protein